MQSLSCPWLAAYKPKRMRNIKNQQFTGRLCACGNLQSSHGVSQQDFSLSVNTNEVSNRQQRTWLLKAWIIAFKPALPILFQDTGFFANVIAYQSRPKALQLTRNDSQGANGKCSNSENTPIFEKFLQLIFFKIRLPDMTLATASAPSWPAELLDKLMSSRAKSFRLGSGEVIAFIIAW